MKNNTIRYLMAGFGFSLLLLLLSTFASVLSISRLVDSFNQVGASNTVSRDLENIISNMKDAETGFRGYLITRDSAYLEPYSDANDRVKLNFDNVKILTANDPVQQQYLMELQPLIAKRFRTIENGLARDADQLVSKQAMLEGKNVMDEIRLLIGKMKNEEANQLAAQSQTLEKYNSITPFIIIGAALLSMLITVVAFLRIRGDVVKRERLQRELEETAEALKQRVAIFTNVAEKISAGNYSVRVDEKERGELGGLADALNRMGADLQAYFAKLEKQAWLQQGEVTLNEILSGEKNPTEVSNDLLNEVVHYLNATTGVLYLPDDHNTFLKPIASFAGQPTTQKRILFGEGLVGQVARDKKPVILREVPAELLRVTSGLLDGPPVTIVIYPLVFNNVVQGVLELGMLQEMPEMGPEYLEMVSANAATGINTSINRLKLQELLSETQTQGEELQVQQDELQRSNAELEMQSQKLQASEEELRVQQEELLLSNQDLEEKAQLLEEKNQFIEQKSRELFQLNDDVEIKNTELELASRYKSEFLANMSHELRTPLNSILLLAKLLSESKELDLGDDRYEYAKVIHNSGLGLLELINEILDLSKIESGQMEVSVEDVAFTEIQKDLTQMFTPLANERNLELKLHFSADLPAFMQSDKQRLEQILKNLLSNAIKFTEKGSVSLEVKPVNGEAVNLTHDHLKQVPVIKFEVKDTGIGIPIDKQDLVFDAFKQVDGSSRRKQGGTGLGLSISREISRLLGGEIHLESEPGKGSTFTVYLPQTLVPEPEAVKHESEKTLWSSAEKVPEIKERKPISVILAKAKNENAPDDREQFTTGDKAILIVEDDLSFVKALSPFVKGNGYKVLIDTRGDEAISLARKYKPIGILLDINLPVTDGWTVIEQLKQDYATRHIPVHIMSSNEARQKSLLHGAIDFINKPLAEKDLNQILKKMEAVGNQTSNRKLLIIEENLMHASALSEFFNEHLIDTVVALNEEEGMGRLGSEKFDGLILDITGTEQIAYTMLDQIKQNKTYEKLPIIVYTGNAITTEDENRINKYAATSIVRKANTYEKLLDEVSIFLHLVDERKGEKPNKNRGSKFVERGLAGKTILVADDDNRNVYALTKVLELQQAKVIAASNGKQALECLRQNPDISAVLIDIMMPEMDGYETIHAIRAQQAHKTLPVIAVTAKTMPNDRSKCIEAGASDYISKPVDLDQLMSLLKVWLY